jgi:hypothetical protein
LPSRQIEIQLASIAHAADRRNRPTVAIVVAALCLLASAGYAVASYWNMQSQGRRLVTAERTGQRIKERIAEIKAEEASYPNYAAMFPALTRYVVHIVDEANVVWPERTWTFREIGTEKTPRSVQLIESLNRVGVTLTIKGEPLHKVFELVERIVNGPEELFGKSFIAVVDLRPEPTSELWHTIVEIDRYEYRPR